MPRTFKIALVGDEGVGKTSWVNYLITRRFEDGYSPTLGVDVHPLHYTCNDGTHIKFNIWDCAGDDRYLGLGDGYYLGSNGAIVMSDLTRSITCRNTTRWYRDVHRLRENIPFVIVGNKIDSRDASVRVDESEREGIHFCSMSVASGQNIRKPLLLLARKLLENDELEFVE